MDSIRNDLSERIVRRGSARPSSTEASHKKHRPHIRVAKIRVAKDAEKDERKIICIYKINN